MIALNNKKKSKICLEDKEIASNEKNMELDDDELENDEDILTFGQKIHLAQKPMKTIFNGTITAIIVIGIVTGFIIPIGFYATSLIDDNLHDEYRLDSRWGPTCNPLLYEKTSIYPAQIFVNDDSPAYNSGLRNGDIITKINDVQINNINDLSNWSSNLDVTPGEIVTVSVIHTDGTVEELNITTISNLEQKDKAKLGGNMPKEFTCKAYSFMNDNEIVTAAELDLVKNQISLIMGIVIIFAIVIGSGAWIWIPKIRTLKRSLEEWEGEYIEESYYFAIQLEVFSKRIDGGILFRAAQEVFPELRKKSGRLEKWAGEISSDNYIFDCFQPTNQNTYELFVAKNFDDNEINFESIKEICEEIKKAKNNDDLKKDINNLKDMNVFRVICIGKNYDKKSLDESDYFTKLLDKLNVDFPMDFIIEKDGMCEMVYID